MTRPDLVIYLQATTEVLLQRIQRRGRPFERDISGEYLETLVDRGVSTNVASFVGATTVRIHELGHEDRAPTTEELERMRALVRSAMEEGALGVGSSLIYAPAFYANTDELVALAEVAAAYDGMYISHLRSEGNGLLEALAELIEIAERSGARAEVYHLKAAGKDNWHKLDSAIAMIEHARAEGLAITTDMYTYTAGATGLDAAMPPWVQEGGLDEWIARLSDPSVRQQVAREMRTPTDAWESLYLAAVSDRTRSSTSRANRCWKSPRCAARARKRRRWSWWCWIAAGWGRCTS